MKKRNKRRLDFEKFQTAKAQNKKVNEALEDAVVQYEALNETLKLELPKLSAMTERIANICLSHFVYIQEMWMKMWKDKLRTVFEDDESLDTLNQIMQVFQRDHPFFSARLIDLGIVNGNFLSKSNSNNSQTTSREDDSLRSHRNTFSSNRVRGLSQLSDSSPNPSAASDSTGQFTLPPIASTPGLPPLNFRDLSFNSNRSRTDSSSTTDEPGYTTNGTRPNSVRSYDTSGYPRGSVESNQDGPPLSSRPYSGLFHSALPIDDGPEPVSNSSRNSSRDYNNSGYTVLYLAASLFEFRIDELKSEAGYPYLTYGAGEIFDVIGEKGELWMAKNQDDSSERVGWIWSKHFAKLASE